MQLHTDQVLTLSNHYIAIKRPPGPFNVLQIVHYFLSVHLPL